MRRSLVHAVLLALLTPALAGCFLDSRCEASVPEATAGDHAGQLCVEGEPRGFLAHVPEMDEDSDSLPLLVFLHGSRTDAARFRALTNMNAAADEGRFIVVYPQGTPSPFLGANASTWNAPHCCGRADSLDVDDIGFLSQLVETLVDAWPIDASHVGIAGHSNGAMMAYTMAAARTDLFASVASVAGTIGGKSPPDGPLQRVAEPSMPINALIIHATDDGRVRYNGGSSDIKETPRKDASVFDAIALWREANGIVDEPVAIVRANNVTEARHGPGERETEIVVLTTKGGHGWPGRANTTHYAAPKHPDATAEVARFFLTHPRTGE